MKSFGSIRRLVSLIFRQDGRDIILRPNQSTTYSDDRTFQLPPGDSSQVLLSQNLAGVTGTLGIANGGTGQTTQQAAINALLPAQSSQAGKVLQTDGTNVSWQVSGVITAISPVLYDSPTKTVSLDLNALKTALSPTIVSTNVPTTNITTINVSIVYSNIITQYLLSKWNGSEYVEIQSAIYSATSPLILSITRPVSPEAADLYRLKVVNGLGSATTDFTVGAYIVPLEPPQILNVVSSNDNQQPGTITVTYTNTATSYVIETLSGSTWSTYTSGSVSDSPASISITRPFDDRQARIILSNVDASSTPFTFTLYKYVVPPQVSSTSVTNTGLTTASVSITYSATATNYEIQSFVAGSWTALTSGSSSASPFSVSLTRPGAGSGPLLHRVRMLNGAIAGNYSEFSVEDVDDAASITGVSQSLVSGSIQQVNFTITSNVPASYSILRESPANSGTYVAISGQGPFAVSSGTAVSRNVDKLSDARNIQIRVTADVGGHILASTILQLPAISPEVPAFTSTAQFWFNGSLLTESAGATKAPVDNASSFGRTVTLAAGTATTVASQLLNGVKGVGKIGTSVTQYNLGYNPPASIITMCLVTNFGRFDDSNGAYVQMRFGTNGLPRILEIKTSENGASTGSARLGGDNSQWQSGFQSSNLTFPKANNVFYPSNNYTPSFSIFEAQVNYGKLFRNNVVQLQRLNSLTFQSYAVPVTLEFKNVVVYECIVFDRELTSQEKTDITNWFVYKYNVPLT